MPKPAARSLEPGRQPAPTLYYCYDGQNVIAEFDFDAQDPLQRYYLHGTQYIDADRSEGKRAATGKAGMEPTVVKDVTGHAFFERQLTERLAEMGGQVAPDFMPVIREGTP